jgi:hypothetical protein
MFLSVDSRTISANYGKPVLSCFYLYNSIA